MTVPSDDARMAPTIPLVHNVTGAAYVAVNANQAAALKVRGWREAGDPAPEADEAPAPDAPPAVAPEADKAPAPDAPKAVTPTLPGRSPGPTGRR